MLSARRTKNPIAPTLAILAAVGVTFAVVAASAFQVAWRSEGDRHFLKNYRVPNDLEAFPIFPLDTPGNPARTIRSFSWEAAPA